ncbi:MAG TPA: type II toxin-antitoxin system ParD family antitoxin [Candidatus Krumholzibacteria bacterium]|nr:type II toxin-antitoxin system ParD family antitoxin [Candidatus Krumholzibacteria bacterium]HRX51514.1 type II toxin-antitoxin system ParD family antitoxin [Candidatus Krumholzibacteria bacterium]
MTSINISMPDQMREWVEAQVAAGRYGNTSEYFRHLIRKDQSEEAERRLESLLLEGLESGEPLEITPEFWEEKRRSLLARFQSKHS